MKQYLVLAMREPAFDAAVIEPHREFVAALRAQGRLERSGAFSDKSGGAYVLLAPDLAAATALAHTDPLHLAGASRLTIYEWLV
ncbi:MULTISPECIES: YciI family protein [unclassified Lysobacter]|uniref:YciI family protein n=1 Tax=unclassified Lysobacter TaxID=2635362 RepID=UPI0006F59EB2|nr:MULTISPECIES: YciI family protein [unclassified Lysobacter]KRA75128.1 hypothetical protein ASD78_08960 [Lysobacter sp. Root667]KRC31167.1 hypothetical protein ASE10_18055 [Lysobacter sp. Root76]KRD65659.1 hypothetical protein ASE45_16760 [Lysobacter sp. Root96]